MKAALAGALNVATVASDPEGFLRRQKDLFGDPVVVRVPGSGRMVISGKPEAARELFSGPLDLFAVARPNMVEPLLGPGSLIMIDGEAHRRERRLLAPAFHGERIRGYGETMRAATVAQVAGWQAGQTVDLLEFGQQVTLRVIVRAIFGVADETRGARFAAATAKLLHGYSAKLVMPAYRNTVGRLGAVSRLRARLAEFDALLTTEIEQRRASGVEGREDILSLLLSARYEDGSGLSDGELLDELRTMVVAGHETTATTLAWALYHLHREPDLAARLAGELAPLGDHPDPADLAAQPYLGAVCQEALRLHPVVPIVARQLVGPWRYQGVDLVAGDTAAVAPSLLHRNPEVWPEPFVFRPDRFVERKPKPTEYVPFGGGNRRCIGATFGEYEMRVVLGSVIAAARFSMPADDRARAVPRARPTNITLGPNRALALRFDGVVSR